jgi:hypothetical protein
MKRTQTRSEIFFGEEFSSIGAISAQLLEDVRHMYQPDTRRMSSQKCRHLSVDVEEMLNRTSDGGVWLFACRKQELGVAFCLEVAQYLSGKTNGLSVFYGMKYPAVRFASDLLSKLCGIETIADIYSGNLTKVEAFQAYLAATAISKSNLYVNIRAGVNLAALEKFVFGYMRENGDLRMVVIDGIQKAYADQGCLDFVSTLRKVGRLSESVGVPVIALWRLALDTTLPDFILSRHELSLAEQAGSVTNKVFILGGEVGRLKIDQPKLQRIT